MGLDKEDIKQLIAILQRGLVEEEEETDAPTNNIKSKKIKTKVNRKNTNNEFIKLGFDKLHKEDVQIDKLLRKNKPVQRRPKVSNIKVKCRVCGRQDSINPALLFESADRYKCNKCCSSPG